MRKQSERQAETPETDTQRQISRRRALARLGLAATVAYAAPAILPLNDKAMAQGYGGPPGPPGPPAPPGAPKSWAKPTKPASKPSEPSKPSKPSKP